jgi:membrane-bound metal-dependent hydrolase YbcI (DUF457 family)
LRGCHPEAFYPVASPVAHSFAGFWTFMLLTARLKVRLATACRQYLSQLVLLVLLANLAGVDFLFGLHRSFTHSLAAAVFVALAVTCVWRIAGTFWRSAALYFLAYGSHLLIDLFTGTKLGSNTTASGIPLLWPWRKELGSPLILVVGNLQCSSYEFGVITAALMVFIVGTTSERPCHASPVQNAGARCLQLQPDAIE